MVELVIPKRKPRTVSDYKQLLSRHILPTLGNLTVAEIDRERIERRHVEMKNTPRRANYTLATIKTMLGFAVRCGFRQTNPASGIQRYREKKRERFLTEVEIGAAADAIAAAESDGAIGPFAAAGLRLALIHRRPIG